MKIFIKVIAETPAIKDIVKNNSGWKSGNILKCVNGGSKTAYGYIWKYKNNDKYEHKDDEEFKNVGVIEGSDFSMYKISNYGNVHSLYKNRILKPQTLSGYKYVSLINQKTKKTINIGNHRLVAYLFLDDKPQNANIVNHIDENKLNNHYKNLEWTTASGNINYSLRKKLILF